MDLLSNWNIISSCEGIQSLATQHWASAQKVLLLAALILNPDKIYWYNSKTETKCFSIQTEMNIAMEHK